MSSFSVFYRAHRNTSRPDSKSWAEELFESGLLLEWRCLHQKLWWCKHRHHFRKQTFCIIYVFEKKVFVFVFIFFGFLFINMNVLNAFVRSNSLSLFFVYCRCFVFIVKPTILSPKQIFELIEHSDVQRFVLAVELLLCSLTN